MLALCTSTRQEAADLCNALRVHVGPDDGWTEFVRFCDDSIVRDNDPLAEKAHAIFAVLGIPINILNA